MEDMEEMEEMEEMEDEVFIGKALSKCQKPYKWAMYGEWEPLTEFYKNQPDEVVGQLTTNNDTVLHVVAVAGLNDLLRFLIDLIKDPAKLLYVFIIGNNYGNTILHEVAASGNLEAAMILMSEENKVKEKYSSYKSMLTISNSLGETPLYRAAAFGRTNMVKYLDSQVKLQQQQDMEQQQQQDIEQQQQDIKKQQEEAMEYHFNRTHDNISILQIAVISQHFETALWLLKEYPNLANRKESNGLTSLQLLAQMPYAFEAKFRKSIWKMLIYKWIYPSTDDLESRINQPSQSGCSQNITRWRPIRDMFDEIKNQKCLSTLTRLLVEKDYSWAVNITTDINTFTLVCPNKSDDPPPKTSESTLKHNPLLIATCKGISKIVKKMLDSHPQAVEMLDPITRQNILHMAIKYRRLAIFNILKKSKSITSRLAYRIDIDGNTILHHAAHVSSHPVDAQRSSGPAFQLQEELRWMARVERIMPRHYAMHQNNQGLTAQKLFEKGHADLLNSAKTWIKETAQSCSTVAALVATVAYAAAFTAPGGTDNNGVPVLKHSPFFVTFAVSDIISLIFSLTSLCTFLSILTSPFEYENFYWSLPFRLHLGFALLFFSLAATMVTFTAAVVLLIHHQKMWTTSLIYVVALLPVSMFGLSQFPLYDGFRQCVKCISKKIGETIIQLQLSFKKKKEADREIRIW
ncbi:protein ACCELERATED CELL DEATH 6-like [Prunus dulcis]|nr:protein ACCELERATED CELL DEATH 6-like [Prunus dulcis]